VAALAARSDALECDAEAPVEAVDRVDRLVIKAEAAWEAAAGALVALILNAAGVRLPDRYETTALGLAAWPVASIEVDGVFWYAVALETPRHPADALQSAPAGSVVRL
jgi:hypothetical protein